MLLPFMSASHGAAFETDGQCCLQMEGIVRKNQLFGSDLAVRVAIWVTLCVSTLHPGASRAEETTVVVSVTKVRESLMIIPLMINGTGPYDFVVDTGSNMTIVDGRLFHDLHLVATGLQPMTGIMLYGKQPKTVLRELSVAGLSMKEFPVVGIRNLSNAFPGAGRRIDGILGEDFLCHYDLLIDNQARTVTFDTGAELVSALGGVRIQLNNESQIGSKVYQHRPMIKLDVPSYSRKPIKALLDSGAEGVLLLPRDGGHTASRFADPAIATSIPMLGGTIQCASWNGQMSSANVSFGEHMLTVCPRLSGQPLDNEGNLPTGLFRSILIAHRQGFVIVNPERPAGRLMVHQENVAAKIDAR